MKIRRKENLEGHENAEDEKRKHAGFDREQGLLANIAKTIMPTEENPKTVNYSYVVAPIDTDQNRNVDAHHGRFQIII